MPRPISLKRLYPAVGEFMIQYAVLQGTLRTLLLALLKVRGQGATALVYGMSDENVSRKLRIALAGYGRGYGEFRPALDALGEVATLRNQLVHWVPFINPAGTTIQAFVDAYRDYRNPPELNCTPEMLRALSKWLRLFQWDVALMVLALDKRERFERQIYRTLDKSWQPEVPKSNYRRKSQSAADAASEPPRKSRQRSPRRLSGASPQRST
jgi:hypothetical protein